MLELNKVSIQTISCCVVFAAALGCSAAMGESPVPVFTKDVLPILQEKCQACHRPDQIAPMSLLTYQEVRPWVKSIVKEVTAKNMPPFHANSPKNHFKDDPRLSEAEIELISDWAKNGAPQGDPSEAPKPKRWGGNSWFMDEPDQILEFPEYELTANSQDDYIIFYSDYVFPEDTWVQAIEFKTDNFKVVHHAGIFAVDSTFEVPEELILLNNSDDRTNVVVEKRFDLIKQNFLITWLPGQKYEYRDRGQGYLIQKGERLILQVHFAPADTPEKADFQVGLKFVHGAVESKTIALVSIMTALEIPPNTPSHEVKQRAPFMKDSYIQAFNVHMHLRGKSSKFRFHYPDGRVETVFDVPKYSFDWQRVYHLANPFRVPKGTQVEYIGEWDNSAENPLNPDPNQKAVWGNKTSDEMYSGTVFYTVDLDEPILVKHGRELK
jgi:hypothetical protein